MPYTEVMSKFKRGELHSGSKEGPKVTSRPQAIAIMMSEKREAAKGKKEYQAHQEGGDVHKPKSSSGPSRSPSGPSGPRRSPSGPSPLPPGAPYMRPPRPQGLPMPMTPEAPELSRPPDIYVRGKETPAGRSDVIVPNVGRSEWERQGQPDQGLADQFNAARPPTPPPTLAYPGDARNVAPTFTSPQQSGNTFYPWNAPSASAGTLPPSLPPNVQQYMRTSPAVGMEKGGKVCASNAKQFKQNIMETAVNRTGKMALAKGGKVEKEEGWKKPSWRRW